MKIKRNIVILTLVVSVALLLFVLQKPAPIAASRFVEPDQLFQTVEANIRSQVDFEVIVDINHALLGAEAGSPMPPAHVLIWSDPELDAAILKHNPLAAVDLPLRLLAYEDQNTGKAAIIANSYDFLARRHSLPDDGAIRSRYEAAIAKATQGIPDDAINRFPSDTMQAPGLITLTSPYDFAATEERILNAINSQSDTVSFGTVDFSERSQEHSIAIPPLRLILFGGPGPGGKAMASAPTLGLDAFCQKLVIWQDESGVVHVTFNDLLALADRQNVSGGLALQVINRRLKATFSGALEQ
jgi:uncharacterized protein (DUF302 family)